MRRLAAVRLVQWYHFDDELIQIGGSTLLLGDNGSGKTTVLDAIQLALVADVGQVRFNKAANEQSRRSLHGYVRWKLGSEDASRPGQVKYGRGECTSYVMLQIEDDRDPTGSFCCGVVLEAGEADTSVTRHHFVLRQVRAIDVPAVDGTMVRDVRSFRTAVRAIAPDAWQSDVGTYRDEVRHRLGALPDSFHRLLVRALDFRPLGRVRDFVNQYLLDERRVDTEALQSNLENYKRLESEAREAERRIIALDAICGQGERVTQERRVLRGHNFMVARAEVETKLQALDDADATLRNRIDEHGRLLKLLSDTRRDLASSKGEQERLVAALLGNETYRQIREYERELEAARTEIEDAKTADRDARAYLAMHAAVLDRFLSQEARDVRAAHIEFLADEALIGAAEAPAIIARLRDTLADRGALTGRDLNTWTSRLETAARAVARTEYEVKRELDVLEVEGETLSAEKEALERGRPKYPVGAEALLHLLGAKLRGEREPRPVCELIEIPGERWRNAIEGYLGQRRFDVIVAEKDYARALTLYERHKSGYQLPRQGTIFISGVGLIDIERMRTSRPLAQPRSLAEQIYTDDELARVFVDFVLGDVICCEDEQELRRYRRAITDTVLVYQGFTARQQSRESFARHYIGQAAQRRRFSEILARLQEIAERSDFLKANASWLKQTQSACEKAQRSAPLLPDLVDRARRQPELTAKIARLESQLARVNRNEIASLEADKARVDREIESLERVRDTTLSTSAGIAKEIEALGPKRGELAAQHIAAELRLSAIRAEFDTEQRDALEQRYVGDRADRDAPTISEVFGRAARGVETKITNLEGELIVAKTTYCNTYGFRGTTVGATWSDFATEREAWRDSKLPEYRARISEAKEHALQQLTEDILHRLRENLVDVERQIRELNRALRDVKFGSERYEITLEVAAEHREFHALVMEAGRFEEDSLFSSRTLVNDEARRTLEGLFDQLVKAEAKQVKTELERRADYREYFDYDMKIHHSNGSVSFYDRVFQDRSGGETQTPFYIAIFASMYRVYRTHSLDGRPTFGLVLLDEAFSKMDGPRVDATLAFARDIGLQLVLATPKERSELVAPRVERTLYIYKDPEKGRPLVLDFTKEMHDEPSATTVEARRGASDG